MHVVSAGPARYFFLRRARGAQEEIPDWPPEIKPLQQPDNLVCAAVYLSAAADGWRAEAVKDEADLREDAGGAFVLTRATTLGLATESHRGNAALALLGVRVAQPDPKGPEYATHLVVRIVSGVGLGGLGAPKHPLVVPIAALVLGGYLEHGEHAEAQLDLRLTPGELTAMPPYLPDATIGRLVERRLDQVILSERQRHELKPEVIAGRVTLYGRAELTTTGDLAREELERTPGVIEVADRLLYSELLMDQVKEALVARGYPDIDVRQEHDLIELGGTVPDTATVHALREIVLRITGVRGVVVNQLAVRQPLPGEADTTDEVGNEDSGPSSSLGTGHQASEASTPSTPSTTPRG